VIGGDAADQRAVTVRIDDADGHIHPRAIYRSRRHERLAGQDIVEVARDRSGLQNARPVVVEDGDLAERVTGQMLGVFGSPLSTLSWTCLNSVTAFSARTIFTVRT
jgi:hypothetical protein